MVARRHREAVRIPGVPDPLAERVAELELRIRMLEARLRELASNAVPGAPGKPLRGRPDQKARPRCPGCLLELPKGRRSGSCVWCGFVFEAVGDRAVK
jgi:hypothetical protein